MVRPTIVLIGTCDTKWDELCFTESQLLTQNTCTVLLMDVGRTPCSHSSIAIKHPDLTSTDTDNDTKISDLPRPEYIHRMTTHAITALTTLHRTGSIHAVLGIGGSCGTALATAAMRAALPVGFPKLMVSTMASGDVSPYVEETDLTLMYSVVDVAGTNRILTRILTNAAAAVTGMAVSYASQAQSMHADRKGSKTQIAITMFGVTTPAVNTIRERLQQTLDCEVYVFHATGAGGKAMERLIREGQLDAVVDLTTTEIPDEIVGGVLSAGPRRLIAAAEAGLPQIISVGACDMVNFGPRETVPARFQDGHRLLYEHNPTVTLMRTTPEECERIARFMAEKLKAHVAHPERVRVILPAAGISMLDSPGQPFHDREADEALFSTLENELDGTGIAVLRDTREINDPEFALSVADSLADLLKSK
ncbi:UPF0261 protein SACE_5696 [Aspergillus lentulus]|uniref:UPF0261 protein SACE_5696 n=1 Tax=Aspergillus lentulus TaxID=293939 RepID=A0ABQ1A3C8_ASPLE|nr:UPF0261 protein SACE_5696 [Aspergillus lentulus]GFF50295.1 UPF0261 protein SACE_5696 [Aspergillus lentulus]GFF53075.1 UPF0261 protein SACE_5696 [Aspergillus lentulus]GFF72575.1 UPF0261 protein SACE_5696 [Aspergillus lentulus]GFF77451.1 UPF0261 protein SACE_5696 [Aspergillus lentulus]GFG08112.1 UPF0261 protein SACE_5696 [Aspergillus lentulus]